MTGRAKIARSFPMVCGIDLAGTVDQLRLGRLVGRRRGRGHRLGAVRNPPGRLHRPPAGGQTLAGPQARRAHPGQTMAIGTAGLTAMLCVLALERHGLDPRPPTARCWSPGPGAGSAAWPWPCSPTSATRWRRRPAGPRSPTTCARSAPRPSWTGASWRPTGRPLDKERWTAAIDTVGARRWHGPPPDPLPGGGRRVRAGRGQRPPGHRPALHPAQRQPSSASTRCSARPRSGRRPGAGWPPTCPSATSTP